MGVSCHISLHFGEKVLVLGYRDLFEFALTIMFLFERNLHIQNIGCLKVFWAQNLTIVCPLIATAYLTLDPLVLMKAKKCAF